MTVADGGRLSKTQISIGWCMGMGRIGTLKFSGLLETIRR
jgi:hypothetical protein